MKAFICLLFCLILMKPSYGFEEECRPMDTADSAFVKDVEAIHGKISEGSQWLSCLESLEQNKNVPDTAVSQFWHKLGGKKVFGLRCKFLDKDAEKEKIFSFITSEGFRTLTFPAYSQRIGSKLGGKETSRHPRTYIKFNHEGKELFISEFNKVGDDFDLVSSNQRMSESSYVRTYETLLGAKRKSIPFTLQSPANVEGAKSCVEYQLKRYLDLVVSATPIDLPEASQIKYDGQMDINSPEIKARYAKSTLEVKKDYIKKVHELLPNCTGVIRDDLIAEIASHKFKTHLESYEKMRATLP